MLENNGADLNEKDEFGESFLFRAIAWHNVDLVKALLSAANTKNIQSVLISSYKNKVPMIDEQITEFKKSTVIDVNEKSKCTGGLTLLGYAIDKRCSEYCDEYFEIAKLLLNHGVNVEERDEHGNTAIVSLLNPRIEVVQSLLDRGADINAQTEEGSTLLMIAVTYGNTRLAMFLLDKGADPFIKNKEGETALSLAENVIKGRWRAYIKDGAKKIIEKIKSHERYKDFEKAQVILDVYTTSDRTYSFHNLISKGIILHRLRRIMRR